MPQNARSANRKLGLPIVEERNFLLATREVGYRSLSAALAELLDNAIQAKAREVNIVLNQSATDSCVAVFDNGVGMDEKTLAHTFDLQRQLRAVDAIFKRVFGSESSAPGAKSTSAH